MKTKTLRIVKPTGNPFEPENVVPATVPIPTAVIITNVEGPFTERDRKLWTFLVHAAWDELLQPYVQTIEISKISGIFREIGGDHNTKWIWESAKRLSKTTVEWEEGPEHDRLVGCSNLLNARTSKDARMSGILYYEIPRMLAEVIVRPNRFARLRLHFMLGLSGKYAVTLYQLLETAANLKSPILEVPLSTLRTWLKVPEGKLKRYIDVKRRILDPALKQIAENPIGAGMRVKMTPLKKGHAVDSIRFEIEKTQERIEEEKTLLKPQKATDNAAAPTTIELKTSTYEKAKCAAPRLDVYYLANEWKEWVLKKGAAPANPDAAFVGFCKRKAAQHNMA